MLTCNAIRVDSADGSRNIVVSFSDATARIEVTKQLQQAQRQVEKVSRAKSTFLANMSHEIRTPLIGMLGLAKTLSRQLEVPRQKRMISAIRQSGEALRSVCSAVLDMSKIEAGRMQLEEIYAAEARARGLEFELVTTAGAEVPRPGDPHRLPQILHHLLLDAFRFSRSGGVKLKIVCRPDQPLRIEVIDTGIGTTAKQCERAFRSFEPADGGTTRRVGGTGLGLSHRADTGAADGGRDLAERHLRGGIGGQPQPSAVDLQKVVSHCGIIIKS